VTVRTAIDGRVVNAGAKLYRMFNNKHLEPLEGNVIGEDSVCLLVRTCQSNVHVAQAARTRVFLDGQLLAVPRRVIEEPGYIGQELKIDVKQGGTLVLEKLASFYTSRDQAISECVLEARKAIARAGRFDAVMADHVLAWRQLWHRFDMQIWPADPGFKLNVPMLLRLDMFHLLQAVSPNSIGLDIGVPARGWTARRIRAMYSGMNCLSSRFSIIECPKSPDHFYVTGRAWARRAPPPRQPIQGSDVPLAERKRWSGGDPGTQPEPALAALGAR